jgi:hypothetical protein
MSTLTDHMRALRTEVDAASRTRRAGLAAVRQAAAALRDSTRRLLCQLGAESAGRAAELRRTLGEFRAASRAAVGQLRRGHRRDLAEAADRTHTTLALSRGARQEKLNHLLNACQDRRAALAAELREARGCWRAGPR